MGKATGKSSFTSKKSGSEGSTSLSKQAQAAAEALRGKSAPGATKSHDPAGQHEAGQQALAQLGQQKYASSENA